MISLPFFLHKKNSPCFNWESNEMWYQKCLINSWGFDITSDLMAYNVTSAVIKILKIQIKPQSEVNVFDRGRTRWSKSGISKLFCGFEFHDIDFGFVLQWLCDCGFTNLDHLSSLHGPFQFSSLFGTFPLWRVGCGSIMKHLSFCAPAPFVLTSMKSHTSHKASFLEGYIQLGACFLRGTTSPSCLIQNLIQNGSPSVMKYDPLKTYGA